ncbi:hypothetical protein TNCV_2543401 [Trichonephila clavipes]|nr:hypothetical protein TNCV_2543401 [Trichonephila clavipes]
MSSQSFDEVLENALQDGDPTTLLNIFVERSNNEHLNYAINKINVIASYLSSLPENEAIVSNILSILMELNGVLELNFEQNVILTKFVLFLVTEENSPLSIVKRAGFTASAHAENEGAKELLRHCCPFVLQRQSKLPNRYWW